MLLPQTRAVDALRIAERVRAHIARLPILASDGEPVTVTVSIGVAALDAGSSRELTELLAAADAALYRAKASGRDQVQMISTSRGLSAVGTGADSGADASGFWQGGKRTGAALDDAGCSCDRQLGDVLKLPAEAPAADGGDSTATTSAFAV